MMKRILAFDYGLRRVGLAVTDPLQIIANSLETVETKNVFTFLKSYCAKEPVSDFVVGFPVHYGAVRNEMIPHIEKFILELKRNFPEIAIHKMDERFTSKMASQTLLLSGVNKKERRNKGNIDAISANIILQSFLEMKANGQI
jgi:putative Holliday junction resolvase